MCRRPQSPLLYGFLIPDIGSLWTFLTVCADFSIYLAVFLYITVLRNLIIIVRYQIKEHVPSVYWSSFSLVERKGAVNSYCRTYSYGLQNATGCSSFGCIIFKYVLATNLTKVNISYVNLNYFEASERFTGLCISV